MWEIIQGGSQRQDGLFDVVGDEELPHGEKVTRYMQVWLREVRPYPPSTILRKWQPRRH